MRMDLTKALARRLAHGDIEVKRDDQQSYVEYDRVEVAIVGRRIVLSLMAGKVELASVDASYEEMLNIRRPVGFDNLQGRLPLTQTQGNTFIGYIPF